MRTSNFTYMFQRQRITSSELHVKKLYSKIDELHDEEEGELHSNVLYLRKILRNF